MVISHSYFDRTRGFMQKQHTKRLEIGQPKSVAKDEMLKATLHETMQTVKDA